MQYPQTRYSDTLASGITATALSLTVAGTAPTRTEGVLTLGRIQSNTEDVHFTAVAGSVVTIDLRGLSQTALTLTEVAGNRKVHNANESVEITTHHNYDTNNARKDEVETISGAWTFSGIASFTTRPRITGGINDSAGNESIDIDATGSAVNQLRVINAATAGNVILTTAGDDADIDLELQAKGTGVIILEDAAQLKTSAAPTANAQIANKLYVDNQITLAANNKVSVSSGDTTSGFLNGKITNDPNSYLTWAIVNPGADEDWQGTINATQSSSGVASANKLVATDSTGHLSNTFVAARAYTAYESISQYDAVCLLPIEVQWFDQISDTTINLGDSNVRRRYGIKFIPSATTSTLTTMQFRAREAVNGATALGNLNIRIETDTAGQPSGTTISNGAATAISQATQQTWTTVMATRTTTWAAAPTLTAGTTYWMIFECSATDAVNYLLFGANGNNDEHYHTFTRLTYNLDTATWGSSVTNNTPFFWFNTQTYLAGLALAQCDGDFAGRAWRFVGIAANAIAAQASGEVYKDVATMTGLTPNVDYYLSSTAGALTTSKPTSEYGGNAASFKIGRAISATELSIEPGPKYYWGVSTATTTQNFQFWGKILTFEVSYSVYDTGTSDAVTNGSGIFDGSSNKSAFMQTNLIANTAAAGSSASNCIGADQAARYTATGGSVTDAGFTLTVTTTGAPDGLNYTWKAYLA